MKPISVRIDAPAGSPAEVVVCLEDNGKVVSLPFTGHFAFQLHSGTPGVPDTASVCVVADGPLRDAVTVGPFELQSTEFMCDRTLKVEADGTTVVAAGGVEVRSRAGNMSITFSPLDLVGLGINFQDEARRISEDELNARTYDARAAAELAVQRELDASIFARLTAECDSAATITAKIDSELAALPPDDEDVQPLVVSAN